MIFTAKSKLFVSIFAAAALSVVAVAGWAGATGGQTHTLSVSKIVKNVSDGTSYVEQVNADPQEIVEFKIVVINTGTASLTDLRLTDNLPSRLSYVSGSVSVTPAALSGSLFSGNGVLELSDLAPSQSATVIFRARVAAESQFPAGETILTNTAQARDVGATPVGPYSDTAKVRVVREQTFLTCPLSAGGDRIIVNFNQQTGDENKMVANSTQAKATIGPFSVNVPQGHYRVTLVSYDDHSAQSGQSANQDKERYFLKIRNSGGAIIAQTNPISDIPGNQNYLVEQVNSDLSVPQAAASVIAFHAAYPDSNPQSLSPVCVAFDRVQTQGSLTLTKTVKNITDNTAYTEQVDADPGDTVEFKIVVTNTSSITVQDIFTSDTLPGRLTYTAGSLSVSRSHLGNLFSSPIDFDLPAGESGTITFRATVASAGQFPIGETILTNTATTEGKSSSHPVPSQSDTARVRVVREEQQEARLTIDKQVRKLSDSTSFSGEVTAEPGDLLEYKVVVTNTGGRRTVNLRAADSMPSRVIYESGSLRINGSSSSVSGFFGGGRLLADLDAGDSVTIIYRARVASESQFSSGTTTLTNEARAWASGISQVRDEARVRVRKIEEDGMLEVSKQVSNLTSGTGYADSVNAEFGDRVKFRILVRAIDGEVRNLRIKDSLPGGLTFETGTIRIDGSSYGGHLGLFGLGYNYGLLREDQQVEISFEALVREAGYFETRSRTQINEAVVSGDSVGSRRDEAQVIVSGQVRSSSFTLSKTAYNQTQGVNAQSVYANEGDIINYTLTYRNTGNTTITNVVIEDDLSDVLRHADVINTGDGAMYGNTIRFPSVTVPSGVSIDKTFQVRVRAISGSDLVMSNVYGNQVDIHLRPPTVKGTYIAPKSGPAENFALFGALLVTAALFIRKKYPNIVAKLK